MPVRPAPTAAATPEPSGRVGPPPAPPSDSASGRPKTPFRRPDRGWTAVQDAIRDARALLRPDRWRELGPTWRLLVERFGATRLIVAGAAAILLAVGLLLPGGAHSDPFEGPGGALDLLLKLGAVLALAYVSLAALRRYTAGVASQRGTLLEVLDSTSLGPNRAVYVVRAGGRRLVLGVTQQQITQLGDLEATSAADSTPVSAPLVRAPDRSADLV